MANALTAFRRIQLSNVEGTPGVAEAATEVLGGAVMTAAYSDLVIHQPIQDRTSLSRNLADDFVVGNEAALSIEGNLNTRVAAFLFCNAVCGNITPTQPDATTEPLSYLWTFAPGIITANTPDIAEGIDTFTIEFGDNIQDYEVEYCFATSISITGSPNEPVRYTWEMIGRQVTETTLTGGLVIVATQHFLSNLTKFYVDATYAGIGGTQKAGLLLEWTWTLETMFTPRYGADGALYFSGVNEDRKNVELELTYLRSTASELEKDKYDARTTTYLRIELLGATAMDSGQANPPHIYLDGAFRYTEWPETDDADGMQTVTVTAQSVYDSVGAKEYGVILFTNLAAFA